MKTKEGSPISSRCQGQLSSHLCLWGWIMMEPSSPQGKFCFKTLIMGNDSQFYGLIQRVSQAKNKSWEGNSLPIILPRKPANLSSSRGLWFQPLQMSIINRFPWALHNLIMTSWSFSHAQERGMVIMVKAGNQYWKSENILGGHSH